MRCDCQSLQCGCWCKDSQGPSVGSGLERIPYLSYAFWVLYRTADPVALQSCPSVSSSSAPESLSSWSACSPLCQTRSISCRDWKGYIVEAKSCLATCAKLLLDLNEWSTDGDAHNALDLLPGLLCDNGKSGSLHETRECTLGWVWLGSVWRNGLWGGARGQANVGGKWRRYGVSAQGGYSRCPTTVAKG